MGDRYINQSRAAKIYGVKRQAIAYAMNPGKALHKAVVKKDGARLIDTEHPAAKEYRKNERPPDPDKPIKVVDSRSLTADDVEQDIRAYWEWTLRDIIQKCGTLSQFAQLLTAADKVEAIHAKRLDSDRKTGELVSREYVSRHVMGLVERAFQRLLTDLPMNLSVKVHGRCSTGATVEDVQAMILEGVSAELKNLKADTKKAIRKAKE